MSIPFLNNVDLNLNQLLNALAQKLATDPAAPVDGQFWLNTATNSFKVRINGVTRTLRQDGVLLTDADVAAANKDGAVAVASMRTIGGGAQQAMAGSTRLDTITAPTGPLSLNTQKITGLLDGTVATDAATVGQVNAVVAGMDYKASVRAATTAAGALTTAYANASVVDGVTLATGDRLLLKDQAAPAENGIYTVNAAGAPTRATDMDSWLEVPGSIVAVEVGTANFDSVYLATADQGGTLGTTAITFSKLGPTAGGGSAAKFSANITGDAATTQFTVTHNLNTTDVHVQVRDVANDLGVITDVKHPTANTVRIDFAAAPATAKVYRVVVIG